MFFLKNHVEKVKIENIKSNEVYAPVEGKRQIIRLTSK